MLDNIKQEEFDKLIEELKNAGYVVKQNIKSVVVNKCFKEMGLGDDVYISNDLRTCIYCIADWITDNTKGKFITPDIEDDWKKSAKLVIELIKPYFGKSGFDRKKIKEKKENV